MNSLLCYMGKVEDGIFKAKLIFDNRKEMPSSDEIKKIIKRFTPEIKSFKLIDPPINFMGEFSGNYFDVLSYKKDGGHNLDDFKETNIYFENKELIADFKNDDSTIKCWIDKKQKEHYENSIGVQKYSFAENEKKLETGISFSWGK